MKRSPSAPSSRTARSRRGFALLEVLIAVLVMAFGMLGIAGMLFATNRSNTSSILKQQAVQSANDIVERIRGNRSGWAGTNQTISDLTGSAPPVVPPAPSPDCSSANPCSTAVQQAAFDTWQWLSLLSTQLPLGSGSIATTPAGGGTQLTITVQWDDTLAQQKLGATTQSVGGVTPPGIATVVIETML